MKVEMVSKNISYKQETIMMKLMLSHYEKYSNEKNEATYQYNKFKILK